MSEGGGPAEDGEAPAPAPVQHRLDPELAARLTPAPPHPPTAPEARPAAPVINTGRFRWAIGIFGLVLVLIISIYQFATHGIGTAGVAPGKRVHLFAAPLATSTLDGDANLKPSCRAGHHDARALNVCLLIGRAPLVLAFFVPASTDCKRQVDVLQAVSRELPPGIVQFAAVAVRAGRAETAKLVRARHWTIPIAYDRDGAVGQLYGVAICPLVELAHRGGIVTDRLIGERWLTAAALGARVRALVR